MKLFFVLCFILPLILQGQTFYASPNGNDESNCEVGFPCTLQAAAEQADRQDNPTLIVLGGTHYTCDLILPYPATVEFQDGVIVVNDCNVLPPTVDAEWRVEVVNGNALKVEIIPEGLTNINRVILTINGITLGRAEGRVPYTWNYTRDKELDRLRPGTYNLKARVILKDGSNYNFSFLVAVQPTTKVVSKSELPQGTYDIFMNMVTTNPASGMYFDPKTGNRYIVH